MSVVEPIFIARAATDAAIRAAYAAAVAAGGGVVVIPAAKITLTSALPLSAGVKYRGTAFQACLYGDFPSSDGGMFGTVLEGDGTFPAFAYNNTDLGVAPTVFATYVAGLIQGTGVTDISLYNFSYGIKCGALYNPGCQWFEFARINARYCGWGFWFENYMEGKFEDLNAIGCSIGQMYFGASGASACNAGPAWFQHLYAEASSILTRGIVFQARGGTSYLNHTNGHNICTVRPDRTTITQAATMANASANISVTDSTKFPVDMPVSFSTSANGFTANQIYFVVSSAANVVQLSDTQGGSAKTATGNTATNILTKGFPCLEIVGLGTSQIQPGIWSGLDMEGGASVRIFMQNTIVSKIVGDYVEEGSSDYRTIALRNVTQSQLTIPHAYTMDADSSSSSTVVFGTAREQNALDATTSANACVGARVNAQSGSAALLGSWMLYLASSAGSNFGPDIYIKGGSNALKIGRHLSLGQLGLNSGGTLLAAGYGSLFTYNGAGGGNATLPTIDDNLVGTLINVSNPSNGTLTLNSSSSQTFNNVAAATTFVAAANSLTTLFACKTGSTFYWAAK